MKKNLIKCVTGTSILVLLTLLIWWKYTPYPSHYISGLRMLGDASSQTYFGAPKEGRGDEWATYIPMLKQAYREHFPKQSSLAPYDERLDWFIGIPHADASLFFLPNQIAYWLFPGGKALSLQALYYYALLLGSILWLCKNLGIRLIIAFPMAIAIICSQFYQVWWTSNFPCLASSILPFAIYTSRLARPYKFPFLYWSIAHAILGQIYPPFYIAIAYGLVPVVLAARPDLINRKDLSYALLAAAGALATYYLLRADFFNAVSATSYPGHRLNRGGDSSLSAMLGILIPGFPAHGPADPVYELAVVGTFYPLLFLAAAPYIDWDRSAKILTAVVAASIVCLSVYAIYGFPMWLAKGLGLAMAPGRRMQLAVSLLTIFYCGLMLSRNLDRVRVWPLFAVAVVYFAASRVFPAESDIRINFPRITYYGPILLFVSAAALIARSRLSGRAAMVAMCSAAAVAQLMVFGSFNPWMRADDILRPVNSQLTRDIRALLEHNGDKPLAIVGNYGHLLRGEGLPVYEAIHMANVDKSVYARIFPSLTDAQRDSLFNRFNGIAFDNISRFEQVGATTIFPVHPYAVSFAHEYRRDEPGTNSVVTGPPTAAVSVQGEEYVARWKAVLTAPMPLDARLILSSPCGIASSWLTRYPISGPQAPVAAVALQGLAGTIKFRVADLKEAQECIAQLRISRAPDSAPQL